MVRSCWVLSFILVARRVEYRFWEKLCEVLEMPDYAALQYNDRHRREILDFMRAAFRKKTLDEWEATLGDLDICWGRVQSLSEVLDDPLFRQREMVVEIKGPNSKKSKTLGVPVKLSDTPGSVRTAPVGFGESTAAILEELGYTSEEIKALAEKEVI